MAQGLRILSAVVLLGSAGAVTTSLSDCLAVAAQFKNTCTSTTAALTSIDTHAGSSVSCSGLTSAACPGTYSGGMCTYARKMCVTCRSVSGVTRIRVQSNSLPASCFSSPNLPGSQSFDFEVDFNPAPVQTVTATTLDEVEAVLCNIRTHQNVPSASNFVQYGSTEMRTVNGFALDGVAYMNQMSAEGVDPFYPSVYGTVTDPPSVVERVDKCLGHPQAAGVYHYHSASPCIADPVNGADCTGTDCEAKTHSISSFPRSLTVMGLAKDGHIMYGPYLDNGVLAGSSGLDMCNGAVGLSDCDGSYAYFASSTFPYLVGCFGTATRPEFTPRCTTNGPSSYTAAVSSCGMTPTPPVALTTATPTTTPATPTPPVTLTPTTTTPVTPTPLVPLTTATPTATPTAPTTPTPPVTLTTATPTTPITPTPATATTGTPSTSPTEPTTLTTTSPFSPTPPVTPATPTPATTPITPTTPTTPITPTPVTIPISPTTPTTPITPVTPTTPSTATPVTTARPAVVPTGSPTVGEADDDDSSFPVWVVLVAVACVLFIAVVAAAVCCCMQQKKNKKPATEYPENEMYPTPGQRV